MMNFEELAAAMGERKTYECNGFHVYTKRDGSGVRMFRVEWHEKNPKNRTGREYYSRGRRVPLYVARVHDFPFTPEGYEAAQRFAVNTRERTGAQTF